MTEPQPHPVPEEERSEEKGEELSHAERLQRNMLVQEAKDFSQIPDIEQTTLRDGTPVADIHGTPLNRTKARLQRNDMWPSSKTGRLSLKNQEEEK